MKSIHEKYISLYKIRAWVYACYSLVINEKNMTKPHFGSQTNRSIQLKRSRNNYQKPTEVLQLKNYEFLTNISHEQQRRGKFKPFSWVFDFIV